MICGGCDCQKAGGGYRKWDDALAARPVITRFGAVTQKDPPTPLHGSLASATQAIT